VTIQAQILDLLKELQEERNLSILFITHDMGVIADISDRVNVMYAGQIVEKAPVESLFANPQHPYTEALIETIPGEETREEGLRTIEGEVPTPNEPATYCRFAPRCPKAFDACETNPPANVPVGEGDEHFAACLLYPEGLSEAERLERHREHQPRTGIDSGGADE
ncbi:MAG: ABC transporter ATP-binding protein, partial [Halodesulfurarchaeum sp.]|nr:ABC transporter ATP-binding protein [Halodesulfurarchaeum sp.]